ncbi:hypothetical protein TVAG_456610 [Trichomonas vaginalis G3]|uniref:Uncharacterized protein n=1 Tax=Trichomonas vaginalis (strain ATCC PRA-98 / G3) TaxID=412133 RepID=A2DBY5_TRIV3|nr:hypothetical protein TVAGG3_0264220 [Trichomonas vaginalis G3]EAY22026.1 hypothetical protein TVAG_456610 [Trichomonas vaginalis G3]KAI5525349.1 hypothetical protein TVAGG3_0264220 [Trichomonas vaginalis G3]|eukprot:XP_001583012.1 hypothetical protein [Trichomonas vaginalis G3]
MFKAKDIPPIDLNSRLVQINPNKVIKVKKSQPSSQRSNSKPLMPRIYKKSNENENYYQQEELIDEKYHLINDINSLKKEVEGYNKQIQQFIQDNQTQRISSLSNTSHTSLSTLSAYISSLQDELTVADKERKVACKTFNPEFRAKLQDEILLQRSRIQSLQASINNTKSKIMEIQKQTSTDQIKEAMQVGEQQRTLAEELMNKLEKLDQNEEFLSAELNDLIDKSSISVSYITTLERLTKKLSHLEYQRIYKQKEKALMKTHASVKNSYTNPSPIVISSKNDKKIKVEDKDILESQKIIEELKNSLHVKFDVPENLGVPRPLELQKPDYCFSYVKYMEYLYNGLEDEYEYYYEEEEDAFQ